MLDRATLEQTIEFIFSRQQPEGGFSFAGKTPPTLEDTYYAVRTLQLIEKELKRKITIRKETADYIHKTDEDDMLDYKLQYQSFWLRVHLGLKIKTRSRERFSVSKKNFEQLYYYVLLKGKEVNDILLNKSLEEMVYLSDIAFTVLIKKKLAIKFASKKYIEKIQSIQNPDGGFGFNDGSTSFLENTYLALKALSALNKKPVLLNECINLIECSRANNGGYGRSTSTVPTLQATYMALKCLKILGDSLN